MEDHKAAEPVEGEAEKPITVLHTEKIETLSPGLAKVMQENKPRPFSAGYIRMYLMCALIYLCSTMNGRSRSPSLKLTATDNKRLRRIAHGIHQRHAKLHQILQSST